MNELLTLSRATKVGVPTLKPPTVGRDAGVVEISAASGFEPIGIVTARIVGKLMAGLQKDAA